MKINKKEYPINTKDMTTTTKRNQERKVCIYHSKIEDYSFLNGVGGKIEKHPKHVACHIKHAIFTSAVYIIIIIVL